jgi:hypothetical protein
MVYFRHMRGGLISSGRSVRLWSALRHFHRAPKVAGFTVMEVLIVLAVTAGLFISAAVMITGKQAQTAFDQSARQVQSQIQQALNEVSTGFYPDNGGFQCTAGGAGPVLSAGSGGQGTHTGCIFLGKALQFSVADTDPQLFSVYTIAGLQKSGSGSESSSLGEARPLVVAPSSPSHDGPGYPDNSVDEQLQSGLSVVRMWYNNGGSDVEIGALAFVSSLAQFDSGQIVSGAGSVNVVAIDGTGLGATKLNTAELMNSDGGNRIAAGTINPSGGVFICFDGGTEDYAIVQIGGESREISVVLTTKDKRGSPCTYP